MLDDEKMILDSGIKENASPSSYEKYETKDESESELDEYDIDDNVSIDSIALFLKLRIFIKPFLYKNHQVLKKLFL